MRPPTGLIALGSIGNVATFAAKNAAANAKPGFGKIKPTSIPDTTVVTFYRAVLRLGVVRG